jgi:branched-chain amino acid transport system permease protein
VLAAFIILTLGTVLGLDPFTATLVALPIMFAVGFALQFALLNRALGRDLLPPLLVTFGLSIIIQNSLLELYSADSRRLAAGSIETASIPISHDIAVGVVPLLTLVSAVLVILVLNFIFYRTPLGRAFRATSDDLEIAQLMGIDHRRIFSVAVGLALVVVAIAALYLGMRAGFDPTIGPGRLLYAFEAVIIGGLGSFWGTLVGGIIVGVAQTIGARIDPEWQILAGHVAFLAVLVLRPRGLFPRARD